MRLPKRFHVVAGLGVSQLFLKRFRMSRKTLWRSRRGSLWSLMLPVSISHDCDVFLIPSIPQWMMGVVRCRPAPSALLAAKALCPPQTRRRTWETTDC